MAIRRWGANQTLLVILAVVVAAFAWASGVAKDAYAAGAGFVAVAPSGQDSATCGSLDSPCRTIQQAVNVAESGDTIRVAVGTYTGQDDAVVSLVYGPGDPGKNLTIIGGYAAGNWNAPLSGPSQTVIDGQGARRGINIVSVPEVSIEISNMTVRNGLADGRNLVSYTGESSGGGLYCRNDNPSTNTPVHLSLVDAVFSNNRVLGSNVKPSSGGGVSLYSRCLAYLENVEFDNNEVLGADATDGTRGAHALGGGLFATAGSVVEARNIAFYENRVLAGSGGRGWLAHEWDLAEGLGGGAAFQFTSVHIDGITAIDNVAIGGGAAERGGYGCGGALVFENVDALVENGHLESNFAKGGSSTTTEGGVASGGGIIAANSVVELANLSIVGNRSEGGDGPNGGDAGGGAVYLTKYTSNDISRLVGRNLVLAFNEAMAGNGTQQWGGGGAVFSQDTELKFFHVTMHSNTVGPDMQAPGLLALHNLTHSTAELYYSVIANHMGRPAVMAQRQGDTVTMDYTLFHNNSANYGTQAGLVPGTILSDHEYSGSPGFVNADRTGFDFHLSSDSVARDKAIPSDSLVDIDLQARPYNGIVDLGADEFAPLSLVSLTRLGGNVLLKWHIDPVVYPEVVAYKIVVTCGDGFVCLPSMLASASVTVDAGLNSYLLEGLTIGVDYDILIQALDAAGTVVAQSNQTTTRPADSFVFIPFVGVFN